jgi:hypothetical protein
MGASIIALTLIVVWSFTLYGQSGSVVSFSSADRAEQFTHLAGIAAPTEYQNLVIYKVRRSASCCQTPWLII